MRFSIYQQTVVDNYLDSISNLGRISKGSTMLRIANSANSELDKKLFGNPIVEIYPFKGVETAFFENRRFLTGATGKKILDFQFFSSYLDRNILDLGTSPSKFVLIIKFLSNGAQKQLISTKFSIFAHFQPRISRVT